MPDLISVIVPIYRVEKYLAQCIQSIRDQTYTYLEIILVDDGSDDGCPQICDHYAQIDERIKVIHKKNGGVDSARKAGMSVASGKYIGYVDGDDWIEPEMYGELLQYAYAYNVDVVESGVIDSLKDKENIRIPYFDEGCYKDKDFVEKIEPKLLYSGVFFSHGISPYMWSKLFLKETVWKYQMMEGMINKRYDDIMVCLPSIVESKRIYISHNCYYHYRVRQDSLKRKCIKNDTSEIFNCYIGFYSRFKKSVLSSSKDKQIQYYMMYDLLYKAPYIFDDIEKNIFLKPFGGVPIRSKIVLYGAGAVGIHLQEYIQSVKGSDIVCWVDRNYKSLQEVLNVKDPKKIISQNYDHVIISILRENAVKSAKKDLIGLGVQKEKILWIKQEYIDSPETLLCKVRRDDMLLS